MIRLFIFASLIGAAAACSGAVGQGQPDAPVEQPLPGDEAAEFELRPTDAVSLKQLQEALRSPAGPSAGEDLSHLGGLTRVRAVYFEGEDILLAGDREPGVPALETDHLVVALRNAFAVGPEYEGVIGCTIDPRPGRDPWRLQDAKIFGGPPSSLSLLHVQVDYALKKVGAGYERMAGVASAFELNDSEPCSEGGSYSAAHRYWFTPRIPESPRFEEDDTAIWIQKPIHVQLKTEEEFLDARGERQGAREAQPAASEFARQVTALLATNDEPLTARTRQSFRLVEIAQLVRRRPEAASAVAFFLRDYRLPSAPVPKEVDGVMRTVRKTVECGETTSSHGGRTVVTRRSGTLEQEYRGGVEARIELTAQQFVRDVRGVLRRLRDRILASRPHGDVVAWQIRY